MNAVEFLKEERRMCEFFGKTCVKCPFRDTRRCAILLESDEELEKTVAIVEQWSKEHPVKTRQSVFLKQFPKAELDVSGVITICPAPLSEDYRNDHGGCKHPGIACSECRRKFWGQKAE